MSNTPSDQPVNNLTLVDEDYENRMAAALIDCNDGKGDSMACHQVGQFYSVVKEDHATAAAVYRINCDSKKYSASCFNLGRLYLTGRGVDEDDEKAQSLFDRACNGDHLFSCYMNAAMTYNKASLAKPPNCQKMKDAIKMFEDNCEKGEWESCEKGGALLLDPRKKELRDPGRAIPLLERACKSNNAASCFNLARLYKFGDVGVAPNAVEFKLYDEKTRALKVQLGGSLKGKRMS